MHGKLRNKKLAQGSPLVIINTPLRLSLEMIMLDFTLDEPDSTHVSTEYKQQQFAQNWIPVRLTTAFAGMSMFRTYCF